MRKVRLGQSDLEIVPLVFGGNVFGWTLDEKQSFDILDAYLDKGFDAVDTSNQYSHWVPGNTGGESETIIGNWLKKSGGRDKIVLMTKVGGTFPGNPKPNTSKKHILEQVDVSLKRLQTDYIDLYQTHYDDESIPVEETLEAYEQLVKEGKVRWIGTSNMSAQRVLESIELSEQQHWSRYQTLQPEYNLFSREKYETEYEQLAVEQQLGVLTYYSLASGFLTGKYKSEADFNQSARSEGVKKQYWNERGKRIVAALEEVADAYKTTSTAVALAWLIARPSVAAPIVSATRENHLEPFVSAVQLQLSPESMEKLDAASDWK